MSDKQKKMKMDTALKVVIWVFVIVIFLPVLLFTGYLFAGVRSCNREREHYRTRTTDIYEWRYHRSLKDAAEMVGFTEDAEFPSRLTIPAFFGEGNSKVPLIDFNQYRTYGCGSSAYAMLTVLSDRIYFPYTLRSVNMTVATAGDVFLPAGATTPDSADVHSGRYETTDSQPRCFVPYERYRHFSIERLDEVNKDYDYLLPANVTYRLGQDVYMNDGIYFIDHLDETGKLTEPPIPTRGAQYRFEGWYLDKYFEQKWDFSEDVLTVETDPTGEPIFAETNLYAKWVNLTAGVV